MISLPHRTLFVHVPKCAGQSVEAAFCAGLGLDWGKHRHLLGCMQRPQSWPKTFPERLAHLTAHEYVALNFCPREMFESFYKFAIVRDPIERVVSAWRYLGGKMAFDAFVAERLPVLVAEQNYFFRSQKVFLCEPGTDRLLVDHVVPFSRLAAEWSEVQQRAGVSAPLGHRNRSKDSLPKPAVTTEDRSRIDAVYAEDYALFDVF
ncbi:MAG: sulfotransferase family 2 domain-containing protein [Pseudomonadota bacterium]